MSNPDLQPTLQNLWLAAQALRTAFAKATADKLFAPESPELYHFEIPITPEWLKALERPLLNVLLKAGFDLTVTLTLPNGSVQRRLVEGDDENVEIELDRAFPDPGDELAKALPEFNRLKAMLTPDETKDKETLSKLLDLLAEKLEWKLPLPRARQPGGPETNDREPLSVAAVLGVEISLAVSLAKAGVIVPGLGIDPEDEKINFLTFLFPESLATRLANESLDNLEGRYFEPDKRTVIVVFGMQGRMVGPYLAVYGWNEAERARKAAGLHPRLETHNRELLSFRNRNCLWPRPTSWLAPGFFSLRRARGIITQEVTELRFEFRKLQVLLAILFLAAEIRSRSGGRAYEVLFGRGQQDGVTLEPSELASFQHRFDDVVKLYGFAYRDLKVEKLDIVHHTLELWVRDVASIFETAERIRTASEKILENYLKGRVAEYFDAKRKTQDYIQEVVLEVGAATLSLTRSVAENAYKTVGVIAAAVITALLKPAAGETAAALAAAVIAAYVGLILFYYLPTIRETEESRKRQFRAHLRSFSDVLGKDETEELIANQQVADARADFERRGEYAHTVYAVILGLAVLSVLYFSAAALGLKPGSHIVSFLHRAFERLGLRG